VRSLILAGGGLKVGYQAGCLQVLLDELQLEFDHVDAASGGCMNAAMMASGMTGTQIADAWRTVDPAAFTTLNLNEYHKLFWAASIGTADGLKRVFAEWKLDFAKIRRKKACHYTFNCFNFSKKTVVSLENTVLDEEYLLASVALPMWFPPIRKNGQIFFDAVYCTDGNVGEAVRRGADEIWAIWTVTDLPEYRDGFFAQYFHIIETVANAKFNDEWEEIAAVNQAIAIYGAATSRTTTDLRLREGFSRIGPPLKPPPGRKKIEQHLIKQEVPVHYVAIFNRDRMAAAVEMGVQDTRQYASSTLKRSPAIRSAPTISNGSPIALQFSETMRGYFMRGISDYRRAARRGRAAGNRLIARLRIRTNDLDAFLTSPEHQCGVNGSIEAPLLSAGEMLTTGGSFQLFVNDRAGGPEVPSRVITAHKKMIYSLQFTADDGVSYVLEGKKLINDEAGFALWRDTTTLFVQIYEIGSNGERQFYGAGILRVLLLDFLKELLTFKVDTVGDWCERADALMRFGRFFFGQAWDVYARWILDYAPV
jgi:predicted acylesterase/phospholipase RssA